MSDFGVLLSVSSGQPFITPVSTPMALYGKYTVNSTRNSDNTHSASMSIPWVNSRPVMVFVKSNVVGVAMGATKTANIVVFSGAARLNTPFTLTAYVFGIFPQVVVPWGMCVWDSSGQAILTNETKVLSDLVTIGQVGVNKQSGITMDITLNGSYAVCPVIHGSVLFQIAGGAGPQPIIVNVEGYTSCANIDGTTRFTAALNQAPGGSPVGSINSGCSLFGINTAAYD